MSFPTMVVLFDVDNTLLDNDRITADLTQYLDREVGPAHEREYWRIFDDLREELGYADYLGALQRYRLAYPHDSHLLAVSHFLVNYPFADRLFPQALDVVRHARQWGRTVILTDGDAVFQPRKIDRSGLFEAVEGAGTEGCRAAVSCRPLCADRRQVTHPERGESPVGGACHHGVSASGALCQ